MSDVAYALGGYVAGMFIFMLVMFALMIASWVVTAVMVKRLADFCGVLNTWQAWLPFAGVQLMLVCQSLDEAEQGSIPAVVYQICGYGSIAIVGGFVPILGALLMPVGMLLAIAMSILTAVSMGIHGKDLDYSPVGPILCLFLIPFFGAAVATNMLNKHLQNKYA